MEAGANVCAYFVWSLLDNWEWGDGFSKRFGLYSVDDESQATLTYPSFTRTAKDSVAWLRGAISRWPASHGCKRFGLVSLLN